MKTFLRITLFAVLSIWPSTAQLAPATIVEIDIENRVFYVRDVNDFSNLASDATRKTPLPSRNFAAGITLADIVAVNGKPARGVYVDRATVIQPNSNPRPGQAIADVSRGVVLDGVWEILQPDGTSVGSIMAVGFGGGPPPPGSPPTLSNTNLTIVGGTGAFLGVRG